LLRITSLAADLQTRAGRLAAGTCVAVLSGGNIAERDFATLVAAAPVPVG